MLLTLFFQQLGFYSPWDPPYSVADEAGTSRVFSPYPCHPTCGDHPALLVASWVSCVLAASPWDLVAHEGQAYGPASWAPKDHVGEALEVPSSLGLGVLAWVLLAACEVHVVLQDQKEEMDAVHDV